MSPTVKTTTTSPESIFGQSVEQTGRKIMAKIPFANNLLENKIDQWGQPIKDNNPLSRGVQNFISPGYVSVAKTNPVNTEVNRLFKATGKTEALPTSAPSSLTLDGTKYYLTPKELTQYQRTVGQNAFAEISKTINSSDYKKFPDTKKGSANDRIYLFGKAYKVATDKAKQEFFKGRGIKTK